MLVALLIVPLLGFVSLVSDLGEAYSIKSRTKSAIDLAAIAGISQLEDYTYASTSKSVSLSYLNDNLSNTLPGFTPLSLSSSNIDIQIGIYDSTTKTFTNDEFNPAANSIMINYSHVVDARFANVFMLNQFTLNNSVIASKEIAGYAASNTTLPLTIEESALTAALSNSYMVDLYQSSGGLNSHFTAYDGSANSSDILNQFDHWGIPTGSSPTPASKVDDVFTRYSGSTSTIYSSLPAGGLTGSTYIIPVVSRSGNDVTIQGFVGATIDSIDTGSEYFSITILPAHIDNDTSHGGLKVTKRGNINTTNQPLLANSFLLVL